MTEKTHMPPEDLTEVGKDLLRKRGLLQNEVMDTAKVLSSTRMVIEDLVHLSTTLTQQFPSVEPGIKGQTVKDMWREFRDAVNRMHEEVQEQYMWLEQALEKYVDPSVKEPKPKVRRKPNDLFP